MTNNVLKFKCKYTVISRNKSHSQPITQLTVDNLPMEQLQSYMQVPIGVGLPTLTWSVPLENVCQRARRQIGVKVLCLFKQLNTITTLYLVCSTSYRVCCASLGHTPTGAYYEKVCTESLHRKCDMDYDSLLNYCEVPTLVSSIKAVVVISARSFMATLCFS